MSTPRKTISQQRARTAERRPDVKLTPCGVVRVTSAGPRTCALERGHDSDHAAESFTWRRSSGDDQA